MLHKIEELWQIRIRTKRKKNIFLPFPPCLQTAFEARIYVFHLYIILLLFFVLCRFHLCCFPYPTYCLVYMFIGLLQAHCTETHNAAKSISLKRCAKRTKWLRKGGPVSYEPDAAARGLSHFAMAKVIIRFVRRILLFIGFLVDVTWV